MLILKDEIAIVVEHVLLNIQMCDSYVSGTKPEETPGRVTFGWVGLHLGVGIEFSHVFIYFWLL